MNQANPTFDDIWRLFQETDRKFQETDRKFQETDRKFQETDRKFQETERLMKESAQETDRKFQETERLMKESAQETDRKFQETERLMKESAQETERLMKESAQETERLMRENAKKFDLRVDKLRDEVRNLTGRMGDFVEAMVQPALNRLFAQRDIEVKQIIRHMTCLSDTGQLELEIDLLVVSHDILVAVECKSNLSVDDVNEHLERMSRFRTCCPLYQHYRVMGAVAGMVVSENVGRYAYRKGFFVLAQSGETVTILNDTKFTPTEW